MFLADSPFKELIQGNFCEILEHNKNLLNETDISFSNLNDWPSTLLKSIGIGSLLAFTQDNFTGPDFCCETIFDKLTPDTVNSKLNVDGEELNVNVKHAELLLISREIWQRLVEHEPADIVNHIWLLRSIVLHQKVIDEPCISLYEGFKRVSAVILEKIDQITELKDQILLRLEIVQGYLMYKRVFEAENILKELKESLKLDTEIKGFLGVRTKYQQKALPQLVLTVENSTLTGLNSSEITHGKDQLPKLLVLDDDLRLEKIKFESDDANQTQMLESAVQNFVFTIL